VICLTAFVLVGRSVCAAEGNKLEAVQLQLAVIRTLASTGKLEDAAVQAERLRQQYPRCVDVLELAADIAGERKDNFAALSAYQAILALEPSHRGALLGKIRALGRLGAPQLALDLSDRNPDLLPAREREAMGADRVAHAIRSGAIATDTGIGPARFAAIDRALADSEDAGRRALEPVTELTPAQRQLALDRIVALGVRFRMGDAVALFEALALRPAELPAYARAAAASAYLYLERPERAVDLYRSALTVDPANLGWRIGLFYALAESERHDAALVEAERALASTPLWTDAWSQATIRENPAYARAAAARAMAPLLANRPGEAEGRLHALSNRAPYNLEIRTDYASTMRARGWPRAAERELRWILAADPCRQRCARRARRRFAGNARLSRSGTGAGRGASRVRGRRARGARHAPGGRA
jgi:biofilm PGA synthesis protein PgaA